MIKGTLMRQIQILGTGCSKCTKLAANADQAVKDSGVDAEVVKVREIAEILTFDGIRALPALAVDGVVKVCGRVPDASEIQTLIA